MDYTINFIAKKHRRHAHSSNRASIFASRDYLLKKVPEDLRKSICDAFKAAPARKLNDILRIFKERIEINGKIPKNLVASMDLTANEYLHLMEWTNRGGDIEPRHLKAIRDELIDSTRKSLKNHNPSINPKLEIPTARLLVDQCVLSHASHELTSTASPRPNYFTQKAHILGREVLKTSQRTAQKTLQISAALVITAALIGYVMYPWYKKMRGKARKAIEEFQDLTQQPDIHEVLEKIELTNTKKNNNKKTFNNAPKFIHTSPPVKKASPKIVMHPVKRKPWFGLRIGHINTIRREQAAEAAAAGQRVVAFTTAASQKMKVTGPQACRSDQIVNPDTGYCVKRTGAIGQSILAKASISTATTQRVASNPATSRTRTTAPATYTQYYY